MKVIFAHDWLNGMRGGEKCLESLIRLYPDSAIRTLLAEPAKLSDRIRERPIRTSFVQKIPGAVERYKWFLPLFPLAIRTLDPKPGECDLVISTSHCVAKGLRAPKGTPHICYIFTPMRYAWLFFDEYFGNFNALLKPLLKAVLACLRIWDRAASRHVTHFVAISEHVRKRVQKFYGRDAAVIYPPADLDFYAPDPADAGRSGSGAAGHGSGPAPREDFYLLVSALVPYKRPDLAVEACGRLGKRLVVIGSGPELDRLKAMAGPNVTFLGWASNEDIRDHYRRCRALIFPGEEDYGIVPVEVQGCGAPVIAYGVGGALETVADGVSGLFFDRQTPEALIDAIRRSEVRTWDPAAIRRNALRFSEPAFREAFARFAAASGCSR
jgi:glycosyltransferase involved in cell wall biosynthesis